MYTSSRAQQVDHLCCVKEACVVKEQSPQPWDWPLPPRMGSPASVAEGFSDDSLFQASMYTALDGLGNMQAMPSYSGNGTGLEPSTAFPDLHSSIAQPSRLQQSACSEISPCLVPTSAFQTFSQEQSDGRHVVIEIHQPMQEFAPTCSKVELIGLSHSFSETMDLPESMHMSLHTSGGLAYGLKTSESAPAAYLSLDDRDATAALRPTVQTGMYHRSESAPSSAGGKKVYRTAEERKAHRMAKNRATAAASRQRKKYAKLQDQKRKEIIQDQIAHLQQLLSAKSQEVKELEMQIANAEAAFNAGSLLPDDLLRDIDLTDIM